MNVGATVPVYRIRHVSLRCFDVGFGRLDGLIVDSCGARSWRQPFVCCIGFRPIFLINWPSLFDKLPHFK